MTDEETIAALRAENAELREALADVCDAVFSARTSVHGIRCIRAAALDIKVPFSLEVIKKYAAKGHDDSDMWCQNTAADCADRDQCNDELLAAYNEAKSAAAELIEIVKQSSHDPFDNERAQELLAVFV